MLLTHRQGREDRMYWVTDKMWPSHIQTRCPLKLLFPHPLSAMPPRGALLLCSHSSFSLLTYSCRCLFFKSKDGWGEKEVKTYPKIPHSHFIIKSKNSIYRPWLAIDLEIVFRWDIQFRSGCPYMLWSRWQGGITQSCYFSKVVTTSVRIPRKRYMETRPGFSVEFSAEHIFGVFSWDWFLDDNQTYCMLQNFPVSYLLCLLRRNISKFLNVITSDCGLYNNDSFGNNIMVMITPGVVLGSLLKYTSAVLFGMVPLWLTQYVTHHRDLNFPSQIPQPSSYFFECFY